MEKSGLLDLRIFPFFQTIPPWELANIKKVCRYQKFASGTKILDEGEEPKEFILLLEGQIAVLKMHQGKKKTLFSLDPGQTYGEVEILNGTPILATLVGYQDFQVMFVPKEVLLRLIGLYQGFAREIRDMYSRRAYVLLQQGVCSTPFGRIVTFFNTKGGGLLTKKWGKRVVLVDLNLSFGDQSVILNLPIDKNIFELSRERPPLKIEKIEAQLTRHRSGLQVLLPPPLPELSEKIRPEFVEQVLDLLRAHYDYVIVDTPNHLTDLEARVLEESDLILLMMTMELTFIKNTKLLLELFQRMKIPRDKVKIVLNRAFKSLGLEPSRVESSLRYAISHFIPSDGEVVIPSINNGVPFVLQKLENSPLIFAVEKLCRRIVGEEPDKGTWNMFSLIREVLGL
ncbi:cyclic nucleotide-binding domain-containing protein [bacterium]|nr:cyclic nucleotide-binding domain-containing protein [bacterium]